MNPELYSPEEREIAREILCYLEKHPDAKDTVNGILQWWLLPGRVEPVERALTKVERAVSFLLSQHLILETRRKGLRAYYELNHEKEKEISKILEHS